jgi:DNA-binding response OmpR family regulator
MYKLLIIDDQVQQLKQYTKLFRNDFECFTATSGESGIDIFHQESPHIILCDVRMPGGMSGFDLCQKIKSISPQTVIVLASSYNNTADRIKGYESRADEYLNKMTTDQEVYLKVRNLVYTNNNTPASFPSEETSSLKSIDAFEDIARSIITEFYKTSLHHRKNLRIDLDLMSEKMHKSSRTIQRDFSKKLVVLSVIFTTASD